MLKYFFITLISLSFQIASFAQTPGDFEAELQLLEKHDLEIENTQMKAVEEISTVNTEDFIEDSISNTQASTLRVPIEIKPIETIKARRVRSR